MTVAKHTDLIVGMDMHWVVPPMSPPVMVPIPVAGIILDPSDYDEGACTVHVNGLPRARAGTLCQLSPPHIPIGGPFLKPPLNESEVYEGSSTVTADGDALSAMGHRVLGCDDLGAPAPARAWKSGGAKSLMAAGCVVIAIPAGAPVLVGGAPAVSASRDGATPPALEWVEITLKDTDGEPVVGARYEITFADRSVRAGTLGEEALVAFYRAPAGELTFRIAP